VPVETMLHRLGGYMSDGMQERKVRDIAGIIGTKREDHKKEKDGAVGKKIEETER